jgi:uncharacterized membrane protein
MINIIIALSHLSLFVSNWRRQVGGLLVKTYLHGISEIFLKMVLNTKKPQTHQTIRPLHEFHSSNLNRTSSSLGLNLCNCQWEDFFSFFIFFKLLKESIFFKTYLHGISEIFLKMVLNTKKPQSHQTIRPLIILRFVSVTSQGLFFKLLKESIFFLLIT